MTKPLIKNKSPEIKAKILQLITVDKKNKHKTSKKKDRCC